MRSRLIGAAVIVIALGAVLFAHCRQKTSSSSLKGSLQPTVIDVTPPRNDKPIERPTGTIRLEGQVIGVDNEPVAGANVEVRDDERTFDDIVTTEADGSFAFERLPAKHAYVYASKGDALASLSQQMELAPNPAPVVLQLWPATSLKIYIVDGDTQQPLKGATVVASSSIEHDAETGPVRAASDDRGVAVVPRLLPGSSVIAWIRAARFETTMIRPSLSLDGTNEVFVSLHHCAPLSGFVRTESGSPVASATVVSSSDYQSGDTAETDATGAFQFDCLAAGRHAFFTGGLRKTVLDLDGHPRTDVVFTIPDVKLKTIAGIVVDQLGAPVEGAEVHAHADAPFKFDNVKSDHDGRFAVHLELQPMQDVRLDADSESSIADPVVIGPSERERNAMLRLRSANRTTGFVVDRSGAPVGGAVIKAEGWVTADRSGHFTLRPARATEVTFVAEYPDQVGGTTQRVVVHSGQQNVRVVLSDLSSIHGRLVRDGEPVTAFTIELAMNGYSVAKRSFRSSDGTFEVEKVVPGSWTLTVGGPGFRPKAVTVIASGREVDLGTIAVDGGQQLRGRVVDQRGVPVANAQVSVERRQQWSYETPLSLAFEGTPQTTADASGNYVLGGIDRSSASRLIAKHPTLGSSPYYSVDPNATTMDLVIASTATIEGDVDPQVSYFLNLKNEADPTFQMHCMVDHVYRYHCEQLAPGDYVLSSDEVLVPPRRISVHAKEHVHLDWTLPVSIGVVLDGNCDTMTLQKNDTHEVIAARKCGYSLTGVPPGSYRLCADDRCASIIVAPTPATQTFRIP